MNFRNSQIPSMKIKREKRVSVSEKIKEQDSQNTQSFQVPSSKSSNYKTSLLSVHSSKRASNSSLDSSNPRLANNPLLRSSRLRIDGSFTTVQTEMLNIKTISNQLLDIIQFMEFIPKQALHELRKLLANTTEKKNRFLTGWVDQRGLDLLQCAIINKRIDIIHLLLNGTDLFPQTHYPKLNPYAHLAATIGCVNTLEALLTYRPCDYFPTSGPQHTVRLPPDIVRRLKIGVTHGMINKHLEKLVHMVKVEAMNAAHAPQYPMKDQSKNFEEELNNIEKLFRDDETKPRKSTRSYSTRHSFSLSPLISKNSATSITNSHAVGELNLPKKKAVKSKVTVHMDMNDPSLDIVVQPTESNTTQRNSKFSSDLQALKFSEKTEASTHSNKFISWGVNKPVRHLNLKPAKRMPSCHSALSGHIELGVRRIKKYKEFHPVFDTKTVHIDDSLNKTPLTLAAERNYHDCVKFLLQKFHLKKKTLIETKNNPLYLATNARSIEAIAFLMKTMVSFEDYQNAVSQSFDKMYPDCLSVLINLGEKYRQNLFGGDNLYHILYNKSISGATGGANVEMLPEMTRVLISCKVDVNSKTKCRQYPLYTLIQSAFKVNSGDKSLYYLNCFKMLLDERANPHYNEESRLEVNYHNVLNLSRPVYNSAIECILANAYASLKYFQNSRWSYIIMQKFIETLESFDKTPRRILNNALFLYMNYVNQLGLSRRILRTLLRYGANPDFVQEDKYPLNVFFEELFSFLTRFEVNNKLCTHDDMLDTVLILCRAMSPTCLHNAMIHYLDHHFLTCPIQTLGISKKFCYYANAMIVSPRSLTHIASLYIWILVRRNAKNVRKLPVSEDIFNLILP